MAEKQGIHVCLMGLIIMVLTLACASSDAFRDKIRTMPDDDLKSYYDGINDRIKDMDQQNMINERSDNTRFDDTQEQSRYFLDGQSMDLIQRQRMIQEEMNRRNLIIPPLPPTR
jgi:hypothetical protein